MTSPCGRFFEEVGRFSEHPVADLSQYLVHHDSGHKAIDVSREVALSTATMSEMELSVPGPIKIVDHALSRVAYQGVIAGIEVTDEMTPSYNAEEAEP